MEHFVVGFLQDRQPVRLVTVRAFNKADSYIKAEELYKVREWRFAYDDLYSELKTRG